MGRERGRLARSLLLSLVIHALLLSLTFGSEETGLPRFISPSRDRLVEMPDLRVVLVPPPVTAAAPATLTVVQPWQPAPVEPPAVGRPAPAPSVSRTPPPRRAAKAIAPKAEATAKAIPPEDTTTPAADAEAPVRAEVPIDAAPVPTPAPAVIAV